MPIANAINQASTSVAQLKAWPHPYIGAPNAPGVCRLRSGTQPLLPPPTGNNRVKHGKHRAEMCQRENNKDSRYLPKTRPFSHNGSVFELIARRTFFRDPYPAFSAAIRVQFTVAGGGGDAAGQTHSPTTTRAQML